MASTIVATSGLVFFPRHWNHGVTQGIPEPEPTYSHISGTLPTGMSFNTSYATIEGTPTGASGVYIIMIRANNGGANIDHTVRIELRGALTIADSGGAFPIYYWNETAGTKAAEAATELASALNALVSGSNPFVATTGTGLVSAPSSGILIGEVPFVGYELPDGPDFYEGAPNDFRFVVKTIGKNYLIRGGTGRNHKTATRWLLENYFGFIYPEISLTPSAGGYPDWLAGSVSTITRVDPAESALPLKGPQIEEIIRYRYVHSSRGSYEWQAHDWQDYHGFPTRDFEYKFGLEGCGLSVHTPAALFDSVTAGYHPTQGKYAQEQSAFVVKNPSGVGITGGPFRVDETIEVRRAGVPIGVTAQVTWPAFGKSLYVFAYNKTAGTINDGDTIHGLTSSASATITSYITNAYPMIFPTSGTTDSYDPVQRIRYDSASPTYPGHHCYSDESLPYVISTIFRRYYNGYASGQLENMAFFFGSKDWSGDRCSCQRCENVYNSGIWIDEQGGSQRPESETLVIMGNRVIADMRSYAGSGNARFGYFGYFDTKDGPGTTMASGTIAFLPHLRYCIAHVAIGEACSQNRGFDMDLRQWTKKARPNGAAIMIWDYFFNFAGNFMLAMPAEGVLETVRRARELQIRRFDFQSPNSPGGDRAPMRGWITSRVLWEPWYPLRFWSNLYCDRAYSTFASQAKLFWNLIEDAQYENGYPSVHSDEFSDIDDYLSTWLTDTVIASGQALYDSAVISASGNSTQSIKVHELFAPIMASWRGAMTVANGEAWTVQNHPTIANKKVIFRNKQDGAGAVYLGDLAASGMRFRRYCGPSEYTSGPVSVLGILSNDGGEVKVIDDGPLHIEIAPQVGGNYIRNLSYSGVDIIPIGTINEYSTGSISGIPFAGWPRGGGSWCDSGQGGGDDAGFIDLTSASGLECRSYVGIGAWGNAAYPDAWSHAIILVSGTASPNPYIDITYSLSRAFAGAVTDADPCFSTSYKAGCSVSLDFPNAKYTVTNIPGLTGKTVTDEMFDMNGPALSGLYVQSPDPLSTTSTVKVFAKFGDYTIPATRTTWLRRRITIS